MLGFASVVLAVWPFLKCAAQFPIQVPNTYPHAYPGMPQTAYGPDWQNYFEVTDPLPNVTFPLARNFAGNVGVNRADHPNATLFFWGFEKLNGSLTDVAFEADPWIIWLNGGPGSSSMIGLMTENGPLQVTGNFSIVENEFSWHKLADTFWVDQPVGTGYATSDDTGYVPDEDQLGRDFVEFLSNIVAIFPSLASRPLYLAGESYAGVYIPYITKAIFSTPNPPVRLAKIAIGDGIIGDDTTHRVLPILSIIETYPELINFNPDVFRYFQTQTHICGYDLNLTYPQHAPLPALRDESLPPVQARRHRDENFLSIKTLEKARRDRLRKISSHARGRQAENATGPSTLPPILGGGCSLSGQLITYALHFAFPWSAFIYAHSLTAEQTYDIPNALNPEVPSDPTVFMNDNRTRAALHAPISKNWAQNSAYTFGAGPGASALEDPSKPMSFFSELASNASTHGVGIVLYSGNNDALAAHRGTEGRTPIRLRNPNTTFGGIQGFTRKPSTPFTDSAGNFAGIVHQERNITYALFTGAGHLVPMSVPEAAFAFVREFVLGSNATGYVDPATGAVVGGENPELLAGDVLPGGTAFIQTATATGTPIEASSV
ncbi:alpha/beta-hydrolase [Mycena olivaceomarginata]|nr:alpha/beta-hydrolase [Mycena olivaceomarginata]